MAYHDTSVHFARTNLLPRVYGLMCGALLLSAVTAFAVATSPSIMTYLVSHTWVFYVLLFAQLGLVIGLSAMVNRMRASTALAMFIMYSLLTGITFSSLFVVFQLGSLALTFAITAGMFGTMALYGYFTKSDLSGMGNLLLMALVGLIIAGIVNIFLRNPMFNLVMSGIGVVIFCLLTAYDVQKIKALSYAIVDEETSKKIAVIGALTLYLDFINLFLYLLSFTGQRRQE